MKKLIRTSTILLALLAGHSVQAAVGFVNYRLYSGDNLFVNPLVASDNHLSSLFGAGTPSGTTISVWNPSANAFDVTSTYFGGTWSTDLTLLPGTGARLTTSSPFTNTFVGDVLDHSGALWGGGSFTPPPAFSGPDGNYLFGDKAPIASTSTDVFVNILGRGPNLLEQFTRLDATTQTYITSTYLGAGLWDVVPSIAVGEAGFFKVGPVVPEPSATALVLIGLAVLRIRRQRG
jgi:hypothetical protein